MAVPALRTPSHLRWVRLQAWLGGNWAFASPRRTARLLHAFARTEEQSQLELRQAASACGDARRSALYLRHALDEARHARAFAEQAGALALASGGAGFPRPSAPSEELYERLGELHFLAFVHQGERRGRAQFEVYARLLRRRNRAELAQLFEELASDERQHETYSAQLLEALSNAAEARRALGWAARWEAWCAFRRLGRGLAGALFGVAISLIYLALAPYALAYRWLTKQQRGFSNQP